MKTQKDIASEILSKMPLDDPNRKMYVDIIGYDPHLKWAGPTGEDSEVIAKLIKDKNLKPKL